jgi:hypothetical protein
MGAKKKSLNGTHRCGMLIAIDQFAVARATVACATAYCRPVISAAPSAPDKRLVQIATQDDVQRFDAHRNIVER